MTETQGILLNNLSALILDFEIDVFACESEGDERRKIDELKLDRRDYIEYRQYNDDLYERLETSRQLVLAALDEWNELAIRYNFPKKGE